MLNRNERWKRIITIKMLKKEINFEINESKVFPRIRNLKNMHAVAVAAAAETEAALGTL